MFVFGRLVQLVRILGRHPRGRGFEFLTAHQNRRKKGKHADDDAANDYQNLGATLVRNVFLKKKKRG